MVDSINLTIVVNEESVREAILCHLFDKNVDSKRDFLAGGEMDSFNYIAMLSTLESIFKIKIEEEEQFREELRTISGIVRLIEEKKNFK